MALSWLIPNFCISSVKNSADGIMCGRGLLRSRISLSKSKRREPGIYVGVSGVDAAAIPTGFMLASSRMRFSAERLFFRSGTEIREFVIFILDTAFLPQRFEIRRHDTVANKHLR